jgi:hypothetical protein
LIPIVPFAQKIFGSNQFLKNQKIEFIAKTQYAELGLAYGKRGGNPDLSYCGGSAGNRKTNRDRTTYFIDLIYQHSNPNYQTKQPVPRQARDIKKFQPWLEFFNGTLQRGSNLFYPKFLMRKRWCRGVWGEAVAPFLSRSYFDIP